MTERDLLRAVYREARRNPVPVERLGVLPRYEVGSRIVWGRQRAGRAAEAMYMRRECDLLERFADGLVRQERCGSATR